VTVRLHRTTLSTSSIETNCGGELEINRGPCSSRVRCQVRCQFGARPDTTTLDSFVEMPMPAAWLDERSVSSGVERRPVTADEYLANESGSSSPNAHHRQVVGPGTHPISADRVRIPGEGRSGGVQRLEISVRTWYQVQPQPMGQRSLRCHTVLSERTVGDLKRNYFAITP